jgi:epidermal growth factor receptor substrate 15
MLTLTPGNSQNGTFAQGATVTFTATASVGSINAWGADWLSFDGGSPESAFAWVGADSVASTSAAPTATGGVPAAGDIVIGALSLKGPTGDTFTQDTDTTAGGAWTSIGGATPGGTSGGSATGNQTARGAYKIVTTATAQTYNPALGTARNYVELIGAIRPTTAVSASDADGTPTESGSVATGSTPISGSDANATTTEASSEVAQISATDQDGATSPVETLIVSHLVTDANGTTTESATAAQPSTPVAGSDANGTTTEAIALIAAEQAADADGTFTESPTLAVHTTASDQNGATTDTATLSTQVPATDANGALSETTALRLAGSDVSGVATEATSQVAQETATDANGATTEAQQLKLNAVDTNVATAEVSALAAKPTDTDTSTGNDSAVVGSFKSGTDANGVPVESATIRVFVSSLDANGVIETALLPAARVSSTDLGTVSGEAATIVYGPTVADSSGSTAEAVNTSQALLSSDTASADDASTLMVISIDGFDQGSGSETATLLAALMDSDLATMTETWSRPLGVIFPTANPGWIYQSVQGRIDAQGSAGEIKRVQPAQGRTDNEGTGKIGRPSTGRIK